MLSLGVLFVNGRGYCLRLAAEAIKRSFLEHRASSDAPRYLLLGKEQELTSHKADADWVTGLGNRLSRWGGEARRTTRMLRALLPGHQKPESRRRRFHYHLVHKFECNNVMAFRARGKNTSPEKPCAVEQQMRMRKGINPAKRNGCSAAERLRHGNTQWLRAAFHFRFQLALPRKISPAELRGPVRTPPD